MQRLFPVLFFLAAVGVCAEIPEPVERFRDAMYMHETDAPGLYQHYAMALADLGELGLSSRERTYWEAQCAFYMARAYQAPTSVEDVLRRDDDVRRGRFKQMQRAYGDLDRIIALYEQALALMEPYLAGGRDAPGVRLYAESLSQLSTLKTTGFLMSNGTKVQPLAEEAIELDPREVKAHILAASRYVYSPRIWGGDPDRGIAMMQTAAEIGTPDREDRHNILVGIGFAHTMADRWTEAAEAFREALDIYPGNVYAEGMIALCEAEGSR